jgi:hypothetical protein
MKICLSEYKNMLEKNLKVESGSGFILYRLCWLQKMSPQCTVNNRFSFQEYLLEPVSATATIKRHCLPKPLNRSGFLTLYEQVRVSHFI